VFNALRRLMAWFHEPARPPPDGGIAEATRNKPA